MRPWAEHVIVMFSYALPGKVLLKMVPAGHAHNEGDADTSRAVSIVQEPLDDGQLISVVEASLIRYFQPEYNTVYKGSYPRSGTAHLKDAYRMDLAAVVVEIDTADIHIALRSAAVQPNSHHIAQFDLHDRDERLSFFEWP